MIVKKLEGMAVLIWEEASPGFARGKEVQYMAFEKELALKIGDALAKAGKELLNEGNI